MNRFIMQFEGEPIPYVRTTQRQKYTDPAYLRYQGYKTQVALLAKTQASKAKLPVPFSGPIAISLHLWRSNNIGADIDNLFKGITDALNKIIYDDDSQCVRMLVHLARQQDEPGFIIEVVEAEE